MEASRSPAAESAAPLLRRLVEQGIRDPRVIAAFGRVPRERFVLPEHHSAAPEDRALDIGFGQTISQPFIVAVMTEALHLSGRERVLEIGTGSGYQTAILAELLEPGVTLRSLEVLPELSQRAQRVLGELGYRNVEFRVGDGWRGWPEATQFDAILVAAAPPTVPAALLEQLAPGGRLIIPVGAVEAQVLQLWTRDLGGELRTRTLMAVRFVPLIETAPPLR